MATVSTTSDNACTGLSLLDIVGPESAAALRTMIDNSPGHSYISFDLSNVSLLKVSVINGNDESIIAHMEMATNENAAAYKAASGEADGQSQS